MPTTRNSFPSSRLSVALRGVAMLAVAMSLSQALSFGQGAVAPAEDYGPYNATFLPDGPGLTKQLAAPSPLDSRTAALLERLGLNKEPDQRDALLEGRAIWTLAFWFRSSEPLTGTVLLAGIGDPAAEDARFIGVQDNHLGLWLGRGPEANHMFAAVDLINLGEARTFNVETRVVGLDGKVLSDQTKQIPAAADARTPVGELDLDKLADGHTVFVALNVSDAKGVPTSNNFYWWARQEATLRELNTLPQARLTGSATVVASGSERKVTVKIENSGSTPALLVKLTLKDAVTSRRILPAYYSENYVSLLPGEARTIAIAFPAGASRPAIGLRGWNLETETIPAN